MGSLLLFGCWLFWAGRAVWDRLTDKTPEVRVYTISDPREPLMMVMQVTQRRPFLDEILQAALLGRFYRKTSALPPEPGIDLGPLEATPKRATCAICAEPCLGRPVRRCHYCDTPYHPECFEYNEGCGRYACKGTN